MLKILPIIPSSSHYSYFVILSSPIVPISLLFYSVYE